jgi:hypothetical protein
MNQIGERGSTGILPVGRPGVSPGPCVGTSAGKIFAGPTTNMAVLRRFV